MIAKRNSDEALSENFKSKEFFTKSLDFQDDEHFISDKVVLAVQAVRSFFGKKIRVTSTLRTALHNSLIGGSSNSHHLTSNATDFEFMEDEESCMRGFYEQMVCKGELYQNIKDLGIKGVGFYKGFIHFDDGESELNKRSGMTFWDFSNGQHGEIELNTSYMKSVPEEGSEFCLDGELDEGEAVNNSNQEKKNFLERLTRVDSEDGVKSRAKEIAVYGAISVFLAIVAYLFFRLKAR